MMMTMILERERKTGEVDGGRHPVMDQDEVVTGMMPEDSRIPLRLMRGTGVIDGSH